MGRAKASDAVNDHPANVWFDVGISTEEAASVQAVLEAVRVPARVSEQPYVIVASGDLSYTTPFVVIGTTAASAFIAAVAARAGQDAYEAIKRTIGALRAARARDQGRVDVLIRGDEGPEIVIPSDLAEGALARLLTDPLPLAPSGRIVFDAVAGRWRDAGGGK